VKRPKVGSISARVTTERAAVVDELGRIEAKLRDGKLLAQRAEKLRKTIRGWFVDSAAEATFTVFGAQYVAEIGAQTNERKVISMERLMQRLGAAEFLGQCSFSLTALDAIIAPGDQADLTQTLQTGPRGLKIVEHLLAEAA
jgi:hypothetical protein